MSSAKSRNFRRRGGAEDEEESNVSASLSTPKIKSIPSAPNKSSAANKAQKPTPQTGTKILLSFADDDEESPFSRPAPKPSSSSSSRFSKASSHKLSSKKDRSTPHPPISSLPSNVLPQAGTYTKEALLELQKNTRTLAAPARNKPKLDREPLIILKGLIRPAISDDSDPTATGRTNGFAEGEADFDQKGEIPSIENDNTFSKMRALGIQGALDEDKESIPDKATIEAIRAKRERMRQAGAAGLDYIALDGGSNHGAAEGLSDEEPENQRRISFLGVKTGTQDRRGVFDDFEPVPVPVPKGRGVEDESNGDEEEDKMWEEEQFRKGLGRRLDDAAGGQGVASSISSISSSIHHSVGLQQSSGYFGTATLRPYTSAPTVAASDSFNGNMSAVGGGSYGAEVVPIPQQAELVQKALKANLERLKESCSRTSVSLAKTEENLSSALLNVTTLENSLEAAGDKFLFMQKLREFISVICEFLQHKAPFIEELEEQMQKLHEERARAISERREADNDDEISGIQIAIMAAREELRKGGSNHAKVAAAASAAAQAASSSTGAVDNAPVELDEFGRDVNLQKRMDITRRSEARQRRRAKADAKRKVAMEKNNSYLEMEGELSTDESDGESRAHKSTQKELLNVADKILSDAAEEYSQFSIVVERFERWKKKYASSYRDAYMPLSIPAIFSPYVRLELLKWDPLHENADFIDMKWHSLLFNYGLPEDGDNMCSDDADANLIPELVEKLAIPILHYQLSHCWNIFSTRETKFAVSAVNLIVRYVDPKSSSALMDLLSVLRDRLTEGVADLKVPSWSPLEMNVVPNAARIAAYRYGSSVRLMRNICLWNTILAMPILEGIALDQLLYGKILPHLRGIQSHVHDAILRTERLIASLFGVWAGPSVTGVRSEKLQVLVDYLLLLAKTLEKRQIAGGMETETGQLVRRLKKMLVELNQYDHAQAISRTFNLKEAL